MLRTKALLLLVVTAVVLAGCNGVGEAETSNATGNTPADTTPPSRPTDLTGAAAGSTGANLSWGASTDNVGVTGYIVRRNGLQVATPATTSYADAGLSAGATYSYTVAARDAAGNISPDSTSVSVTTAIAADTTPPSTPTGLTAAVAGSTGANLSWSASTDNVGVTGYIVRRNGVQVATPDTTSYADTGLSVGTYSYTVAARDAAGNISPNSASVSVTIADTTPPTTPTGLTAAAAGSTGANLSWSASTDNVGVTGYIVRRNGVQVATPATTSYADTGLSAATTYSYTVAARDAAGNISANSTSVSVTLADTTPPTTPTGLTAAAAGSTGANLSWSASTDNVGVTGYIVRRNGVQVATPATTSYADTGLSVGTYSYTVAARDAAGNISPNSATASVTIADTTAPTTPTGLTAAVAGSAGANLSWSASTDNVGVTGYIVRRNGVQVATPATSSYADAGLSAATTYSYTVAARDAAGNTSPDSTSVSVTTGSTADTTAPTTPTGLTAAAAGSSGANLSWGASTDNVGVTGYIVRRNGVQVATPATTSYADTGLSVGTYSYTVAARDAAGNISPDSTSVSVTLADTTPPTTPTGLTAAAAGSSGANLSWSASTDNVGVTAYIVRRNGVQVATPATTSYADTGLSAATTYSYTVAARDAAGNISPNSATASITIADTTPPTTPTGLTGAAAGSTGVNLSWSASTDNVGVTGYIVRRNGVQVATPATTTYADTGLSAATTYSYTVAARDAAGNLSPDSTSVSVTLADTTAPTTPTGLTAAAAGSSGANLSWSASTDNVGVTGYIVRRNGVQVATPATTSYADTGLSAATTYSYTVAARDAAGNISPNSASASITIADTTPPTTPTGLTAAAAGSTGARRPPRRVLPTRVCPLERPTAIRLQPAMRPATSHPIRRV